MQLKTFALLTVLIALVLSVAGVVGGDGEAPAFNCPTCIHRGYKYFCKVAPNAMHTCFTKSGEAKCDSEGCTCCRVEYAPGCRECNPADYSGEEYIKDEEYEKLMREL